MVCWPIWGLRARLQRRRRRLASLSRKWRNWFGSRLRGSKMTMLYRTRQRTTWSGWPCNECVNWYGHPTTELSFRRSSNQTFDKHLHTPSSHVHRVERRQMAHADACRSFVVTRHCRLATGSLGECKVSHVLPYNMNKSPLLYLLLVEPISSNTAPIRFPSHHTTNPTPPTIPSLAP